MWLSTSSVSEVFSEVSAGRCLVKALISIHTCIWKASPEQPICTSISHLFQPSSQSLSTDNWPFSQLRIQLFVSTSSFLKHLFPSKTLLVFGMASVLPYKATFPPMSPHTTWYLPHPALSSWCTSAPKEAGTAPCLCRLPVTTEVQMGICSSSFQEFGAGCYSDKQVGLLGRGTKH